MTKNEAKQLASILTRAMMEMVAARSILAQNKAASEEISKIVNIINKLRRQVSR
jgi:flagellin-specific chaperone FliS